MSCTALIGNGPNDKNYYKQKQKYKKVRIGVNPT